MTKRGKAAGVDEVGPDLLRADMEDTANRLARCYNRLWESEKRLQVWKKGLIVKIFKKGDLHKCNNWRGVTLLPVISKIFCRMMLERIKIGIDKKLQKEQDGFRPKRSTTEEIFILRNILEQANEWRAGLYIHFVDFEKAFDSVHRESLWNITRSYGIPGKMVKVIADIHEDFEDWSKAGMCDVWIPVLSCPGLDHEEGNSRQEKRDTVEIHNSVGGPGFCGRHRPAVIQV